MQCQHECCVVSPLIMIISVSTLYKHIEKEQMSTPYKSHIKVLK